MKSTEPVHRSAIHKFVADVRKAIYKHYVSVVAAMVLAAGSGAVSYFKGVSVGRQKIPQLSSYGTYCARHFLKLAYESEDALRISNPTLYHTLACGYPYPPNEQPKDQLARFLKRADKCFVRQDDGTLAIYKGEDSQFESWENPRGVVVGACRCDTGQAQFIASSNFAHWCDAEKPDPSVF